MMAWSRLGWHGADEDRVEVLYIENYLLNFVEVP